MALVTCRECQKSISATAVKCPQCGADFPSGNSIILALMAAVIAVVIVAVAFWWFASSLNVGAGSMSDFTVGTMSIGKGQLGLRTIEGTLTNKSEKRFTYVQVEINLYDRAGAQIGSTLDNVNNLEPGGTWRFEAPLMEEGVATAKVANITAM